MTRATALFSLIYPGDEKAKSVTLKNGRKLGCQLFSDTIYTVGTYRYGSLYEWYFLVPTVNGSRITEVIAVDINGNPDSSLQKEWEAYAEGIIEKLSDSMKKRLAAVSQQEPSP